MVWLTAYLVDSSVPIIEDKVSNPVQAQVKNPIPEPATVIFLGLGVFGLFALVRRRLKKRT